ncbi:MAG TPA: hypothetical protein VIE43_11840, partial [Thermoanaerobaculia bacterium]|nr:hypothetical protein [Thermoanaerobaculia bacterium]
MRGRLLVLLALVALAPLTALSAAAQSYCQYVCVDDSCRLEQSADVPCGDATPTVLQVSSDPDATACLADPVTMDMVTNTAAVVADVGISTRPT